MSKRTFIEWGHTPMTTKVDSAIERSITQNCIAHIDADEDDMEDLLCECDDSVQNGPVTEFWGRDENGDDWRVHATRERR